MSHDPTEVKTRAAGTILRGIALVAAFWVLPANVLLACHAAALLLENAGLGALATLLVLYHASVKDDVWYTFGNFATIYDIVCFTFLCAALCVWLQIRRAGRLDVPQPDSRAIEIGLGRG